MNNNIFANSGILQPRSLQRAISFVGVMGVGKTTIGRRLSKRTGLAFYDSDDEIEKASGRSIKGYFKEYGETAFRGGECRVIERLLDGSPLILSTGGGAFISDETRAVLKEKSLTIWLKADLDTIMDRVVRKNTRPLLDVPNPKDRMRELIESRYPIYEQAHLIVNAGDVSHYKTVERVIKAINEYDANNAELVSSQESTTSQENSSSQENLAAPKAVLS